MCLTCAGRCRGFVFFLKQKTAYEVRISDGSSDVCSSDLYWDNIGWRVDVRFAELRGPIKPAEHMAQLAPLLPDRYAPLQKSGGGLQGVYLTLLPDDFATALADLIGREARTIIQMRQVKELADTSVAVGLIGWETHETEDVQDHKTNTKTTTHVAR